MTKQAVDISHLWYWGADFDGPIRPAELFDNQNRVELEIGCGKGMFLLRESQLRTGTNFIGVDWSRKYSKFAATRLAKREIDNVRLIADDIVKLFPRFDEASMSAIHAYFPDPWWKKRHRKRRLVNPANTAEMARLLIDGGTLLLATDVEEYYHVMLETVGDCPYLSRIADPVAPGGEHELDYLTHFERKYRHEGRDIFRAAYVRQYRG